MSTTPTSNNATIQIRPPSRVVVVDVQMSLKSIARFMVKLVIAAIPAIALLYAVAFLWIIVFTFVQQHLLR